MPTFLPTTTERHRGRGRDSGKIVRGREGGRRVRGGLLKTVSGGIMVELGLSDWKWGKGNR